ncbi:MAG: CHAT domain-containing protein [Clostridiales bacterium]|jgi:hypothetical protein|nr:CHAT domain-containing protein [Clostridiales bacterium]
MLNFTEVKISLNEAGNGIDFTIKHGSRSAALPTVDFPADTRAQIASRARMFFSGSASECLPEIQDKLTNITMQVTEYLLKIKATAIRLHIGNKLEDLPWELVKVTKIGSTWGRYFCTVRLAGKFSPNLHRTGDSWRVFYDPIILSGEGRLYYQTIGAGYDEAAIWDGGAKDAFTQALTSNNILHIASHCDVDDGKLVISNDVKGEFLNSRQTPYNSSPRMIIMDCCHSAQSPIFSFRDLFSKGCMVFIGHIGKMRVDDGYGSRFSRLLTREFLSEKKTLAESVKAARDTDNPRDYSAVVYVWKGVGADFTKDNVFGIVKETPKKPKRGAILAAAFVFALIIGALMVAKYFKNDSPAQSARASQSALAAANVAMSFANVEYTNGSHVVGKILNAPPNEYGIVLMIFVGSGADAQFYIKESLERGVNNINPDGSFDIQAYTDDGAAKESDLTASMYSIFVVPRSFDTSQMSGASDYEAVRLAAIAALEKQVIVRDNPPTPTIEPTTAVTS